MKNHTNSIYLAVIALACSSAAIVLLFAKEIDGDTTPPAPEKPIVCEVYLHAKPLETHRWKGELK